MSDPPKPTRDPEQGSTLERLKFYKSIKYKMLTSLLTGTISGLLAGIVITMLTLYPTLASYPSPRDSSAG